MLDFGNFKVTMKRLVPISERKTHGCTQKFRAVREKSLVKDIKTSIRRVGTIGELVRKKTAHSGLHRRQHLF